MENQELLEQLQQLQRSLQDIDAARQMVRETINAYNGVSSHIESYSTQLSEVSDRISQLITQISQNRDILSSDIDTRMSAALDKAEQVSESFSQHTATSITSFSNETTTQIRELNTSVTNLIDETHRVITQATEAANELQSRSIIAIETASSRLESTADVLTGSIKDHFSLFIKETNKRIVICTSILLAFLIALLIICI